MNTSGILIAVLLGIGSSSALHISQALMRLAIVRMKSGGGGRNRLLYLSGLTLNLTAPLWIMVANLFADPIWFTSMFATGLVALMLFSWGVLGDPMSRFQVVGMLGLLSGTLILVGAGLTPPAAGQQTLTLPLLTLASLVWLLGMPLLGLLTRHMALSFQEWIFGMAAGGFLALDALWKSLAQTSASGEMAFLPTTALGGGLLLVSFLGAVGAFVMMQWSYWRHCRASGVLIGYNIMYVLMPLVLLELPHLFQPGGDMNVGLLTGLLVMVAGAVISRRQGGSVKVHSRDT